MPAVTAFALHQLKKIVSVIDFTRLNADDSPQQIEAFCRQAVTPLGSVAAVCVFPHYVATAHAVLQDTTVKLASVCNFPGGDHSEPQWLEDLDQALQAGAEEIDWVIPYRQLLLGQIDQVHAALRRCREECGKGIVLKVILETGALSDELIDLATEIVIEEGGDFVKTSTGKIEHGATPDAVTRILQTLLHKADLNQPMPGCKVSGGVVDLQQAWDYIELAQSIMGPGWVNAAHFRIGASRLLSQVVEYWQKQLKEA